MIYIALNGKQDGKFTGRLLWFLYLEDCNGKVCGPPRDLFCWHDEVTPVA